MKVARLIPSILAAWLPLSAWFLPAPRVALAAAPQSGKAASKDPLDDELLKGLGDSADDEGLGELQKPAKSNTPASRPAEKKDSEPAPRPGGKPGARSAPGGELDDELLKDLGEGEDIDLGMPADSSGGENGDDPLVKLERKMREVEGRIAGNQSDDITQRMQNKIAAELERLIKQMRKRKKSSSSSSSSQQEQQTAEREKVDQPEPGKSGGQETASNNPAKDSSDVMGSRKAAKPEAAQLDEALKDIWGQLPPHLRQQMEQYAKEELLPKYELQIEEYFRALAEGAKFKFQDRK
ncbi:MAG TPA: hypothetical protein VHC19_23795 [Pirellulales bacterium]|jgi:hypothetical protein|nr:hypothetical protein [Pirellulales bacterium]